MADKADSAPSTTGADVQDPVLTALTDEPQASPAESSPAKSDAKAEDKKPEVAEDTQDAAKTVKPEVSSKDKEGEAEPIKGESEAVKPEDKPLSKAEERKSQLNTEIRDLVSKRNALRAQVEKANAEVYQPATEDELVDQGMSSSDAKVEALRQEIEMSKYTERVAEAQLTIGSESQRVLEDFPAFNPESDQYNEELASEAADLLRANLIYDENTGQVIGSNVSPYQLYKTLNRASGISEVKGQLKGQQDTEAMLANADNAASSAPPKKVKDPILEILSSDEY